MFSNFSKGVRVAVIILLTIFVISAGFIIGWIARPLPEYVPVQSQNPDAGTQPAGNVGEKSVLQDTVVRWIFEFDSCPDRFEKTDNSAVLGKTVGEIRNMYPDGTVTENSDGIIEICRKMQGVCPNHYILKPDEYGTLCVYKTNENSLELELVLTLNVSLSDISEEAQQEMKYGICFDTLKEIDQYLENAES